MFALLENSAFQVKPVQLPPASRPSIGLFTAVPLKEGQVIFSNSPLAMCPTAGHCNWCLYESQLECEQCTAAYCSATCRDLHRPLHKRVCSKNLSVEALLLVEAACKGGTLKKAAPYQPNWSCLAALQAQGPPLEAAFQAAQVIKLDFQEASRRMTNNNFQITNNDLQSIGCGIFPFGALLNHSCIANTAVCYRLKRYERPIQGFLVLTDITANTQLTHNYCDLLGTREQRWQSLGFQCLCDRCKEPWAVEKSLFIDPEAQAELDRIETLPLTEQRQALARLTTRSLSLNRARHVRLVEVCVQLGDLKQGYRSAVWVYNFDRMCYAYPTHPALKFQSDLLEKLKVLGAS